ncbi:MAG TPA: Hsp70 family protein [Abditibacterium sp.]|jgi:molecular chaperone DnaK
MGKAVGIDLGTTYSALAYVDGFGKPIILKNADGQITTPSVVFFDPPNYTVGETALQATITDPDRVVQFVKRFMGQPNFRVQIGDKEYSPEFVSALILRKIVQDAEMELGEDITEAVITVPAYFTETQRHATIEAGELAGLKVLRIINEPTAAALSYGIQRRTHDKRILVYDLGGGTFDVTVLNCGENEFDVLSVGGDHRLGGKDFDDRIIDYICERIKADYGVEVTGDAEVEAELRLKAEGAKRQLTGRQMVPISLKVPNPDGIGRAIPIKVELTREAFEGAATDLLTRTEMLLESVLAKADLEWRDIDEVLCVGGSSRMPMVSKMLERLSGRKPMLHDPDECVAKGAALQAELLSGESSLPEVSVGHVLSHSLGVAVMSNGRPIIDHILPSLTRLPTMQRREGYTTTTDSQTVVQIRIYEGESADPQSYGKGPLGVFNLDTSPARPKGQPKLSVEFRCDENGRITALAKDADTGKENYLTIALAGQRDESEVSGEAQLMSEALVS